LDAGSSGGALDQENDAVIKLERREGLTMNDAHSEASEVARDVGEGLNLSTRMCDNEEVRRERPEECSGVEEREAISERNSDGGENQVCAPGVPEGGEGDIWEVMISEMIRDRGGDRSPSPTGVATEENPRGGEEGTDHPHRDVVTHLIQDGMDSDVQVSDGRHHQLEEMQLVPDTNWSTQGPGVAHSDDNEEQGWQHEIQRRNEELESDKVVTIHTHQLATESVERDQTILGTNDHGEQLKGTELSGDVSKGK
jgi:hypothetical protein